MQKIYGKKAPKPALYGLYNVQEFIKNNDTIAPNLTETERWRTFVVNSNRAYGYKSMDDKISYLKPEIDSTKQSMLLTARKDTTKVYNFNYAYKDSILTLTGIYQGDSLKIRLKQIDHTNFLLLKRGFHWINESPYNR